MQEKLEQCRADSLSLCSRLLAALEEDREDARSFFAGDVYQAYDSAAELAKNKVRNIRNNIINL